MTEDHIPTDDTLSPHLLSHSASMHSVDVDIDQEEELSQQQITHLDTPKSRYNTAREWFNKATTSQPFAHLLIIGCQIVSSTVLRSNVTHTNQLFAGFCILAPSTLKIINSLLFTTIRLALMAVTLYPLSLVVDRNHKFTHQTGSEEEEVEEKTWKTRLMQKIPGKYDGFWLLCMGTSLYVSIALYAASVALVGTTICAILSPIAAVFACFISVALGREGKSLLKFAGIAAAVIGSMSMIIVTSIFGEKKEGEDTKTFLGLHFTIQSLTGVITMIGNTMMWAVYLNVQKTVLDRKIPPLTASGWSMMAAFVLSIVPGAIFSRGTDWRALGAMEWSGMFYSGLAHGSLNYLLFGYGARSLTPTILAVYGTCAPIVSAVSLYLAFGETTSKWSVIGAALITIGVLMVSFAKRRETKHAEATAKREQLVNDLDLNPNNDEELVSEMMDIPMEQIIEEPESTELKRDV